LRERPATMEQDARRGAVRRSLTLQEPTL
jgi:hypothetical protein